MDDAAKAATQEVAIRSAKLVVAKKKKEPLQPISSVVVPK